MRNPVLYGDGIHDDTLAVQSLLDTRASEIALPAPKDHYCISKTLVIHSCQTLRLPATARIRLLPHSDCPMITNEEDGHDICVVGGIWDYDNVNQRPNPIVRGEFIPNHHSGDPNLVMRYDDRYLGIIMRFSRAQRLVVRDLTLKNPVTFSMQLGAVTHFTVENIFFDQNLVEPVTDNMDGIHIDGFCRFGLIRNVQGTCHDDIVALNADDCYDGPIEDIQIDGIMGRDSLRGVRLLSIKYPVKRVSISNVFGTFYQNAIGLTYFFPRNERGTMEHISIRNVFAQNAPRLPIYGKKGPHNFALIWVDGDLDIDHLTIENVFRKEELGKIETIRVCKNARIGRMSVKHLEHNNQTGEPVPMMINEGHIGKLFLYDVECGGDGMLLNRGTIENIRDLA